MVHNELQGDVIGEVWRAQEGDKEIVYFKVEGVESWFRIEYTGDLMVERAQISIEKLKAVASGSSTGVEVAVDFDELTVGEPPHRTTFNLVRYIQFRA